MNGAILSPLDVRDYRIDCSFEEKFPPEYELPMPDVKNQGRDNACVAYAIATIAEYHSRRYGDETRDLSPYYNYGNRRQTDWTWSGLHIKDALKTMCKYGITTTEDFPHKGEVPEIVETFEREFHNVFDKGIQHRFEAYYRAGADWEIKKALTVHGPVIMSIEWYEDIKVRNGSIFTLAHHKPENGSHAMVIYGWNREGWLVQNSHGTSWGSGGRAVLPYEIPLKESWGIIDEISENQRKQEAQKMADQNAELCAKVETLMVQVSDYEERIASFHTTTEECFRLEDEVRSLKADLAETLGEIDVKNAEIEKLKAEKVEIKMPFSSPIGKIAAKIINLFLKITERMAKK